MGVKGKWLHGWTFLCACFGARSLHFLRVGSKPQWVARGFLPYEWISPWCKLVQLVEGGKLKSHCSPEYTYGQASPSNVDGLARLQACRWLQLEHLVHPGTLNKKHANPSVLPLATISFKEPGGSQNDKSSEGKSQSCWLTSANWDTSRHRKSAERSWTTPAEQRNKCSFFN